MQELFSLSSIISYGAIVRNDSDMSILACFGHSWGSNQSKIAEVQALRATLFWLSNCNLSHVNIELDSKLVVDVVLFVKEDMSEFSHLVHDCRYIFQQRSDWSLSWIRRQANTAAYLLARKLVPPSGLFVLIFWVISYFLLFFRFFSL